VSAIRSAPLAGGRPALLVHGGAWAIPDDELDAHRDGLRQALARGRALLVAGAPAVEVVAETVVVLEAHPAFDAGTGSVLDRSGRPSLDAGIMCGASARWGAVAHVRRLAHPVRTARRLLADDGQARLMVGEGAETFATEHGEPLAEPDALVVDRERQRFAALEAASRFHTARAFSGEDQPRGTVGAVALDASGQLAAATSTGGAPYTRPGRVGDTPLPGCGFFAGPEAAASATGWGEAIAAALLCCRVVDAVTGGTSPEEAAGDGIARMGRLAWGAEPATGGLILLDARGRGAWAYSTPRMARGGWRAGDESWVDV